MAVVGCRPSPWGNSKGIIHGIRANSFLKDSSELPDGDVKYGKEW
jgi:hypothetical protein